MTRTQRWLLVAAGIAGIILFLALTVYFGTAAVRAPRVKHMILFIVLAGGSGLVAWFALPEGMLQGGTKR